MLETSSFDIYSGNSHTWCGGKRNIQRTDQETNQALWEAGKELQQAHGDHWKGGWLLTAPPPAPPHQWWKNLIIYVSKKSVYTLNLYVCVSDFIVVSICETKTMCHYELCKFLSLKIIKSFDCYLEEFHLKKKHCFIRWFMCYSSFTNE